MENYWFTINVDGWVLLGVIVGIVGVMQITLDLLIRMDIIKWK